jgi:hypothetical protein
MRTGMATLHYDLSASLWGRQCNHHEGNWSARVLLERLLPPTHQGHHRVLVVGDPNMCRATSKLTKLGDTQTYALCSW